MASIVSDEYELLVDSKYRSYVSAVDKALKYFENTSEWPDLISALGKLNKVLLSNMKYVVIPRRIVVSKRLAQCMHPALPSGVHLKALETYDIIFKCIGTDRLSQELFIYSAGLFPLLGNAAMNVRPSLLSIYENHFVPLGIRLRPGLPGFLTGVLPGLEEGSEYSNRITELLDNVCKCVEGSFFYGCLWECLLANPTVRLPAVNFVLGHFNRKLNMEDQLHIMGTNVDITVHALCASVQDSNVLVQRSTLDFLILAFPMHSKHLLRDDVERILTAAVVVVLRRDMSLNRRLYSWLLGADNVSASAPHSPPASLSGDTIASEDYLHVHSKTILVSAIKACLQSANTGVVMDTLGGGQPLLWPYRLLISLLDKPEIASAILDDVIIEVFRALYQACCSTRTSGKKNPETKSKLFTAGVARVANNGVNHSSPTKQRDEKLHGELVKTANLLFAMVEPSYIWDSLGLQFEAACHAKAEDVHQKSHSDGNTVRPIGGGESTILEICELVDFLLELVAIETSTETQTKHLPSLIRKISVNVTTHCRHFKIDELTQSFHVCWRLLSKTEVPTVPLVPVTKKPSADGSNRSAAFRYEDTAQRPDIYLRNSVHFFQKCFLEVFSARLLANGCNWEIFLKRIDEGKRDSREEWDDKLDQLLWKAVESEQTQSLWDNNEQRKVVHQTHSKSAETKWPSLVVASDYDGLLQAFSFACQILVDFSSFPICFVAGGNCTPSSPPLTRFDMADVPSWFRFLLAICCCFPSIDFQLVAIGTVLELMALVQPTVNTGTGRNVDQSSPEEAATPTFSVVMNAILKVEHVRFVHCNTTFFQTVANLLWDNLGDSGQQCVNLLLQLHSLAPSASIVEDVIGKAMSNDDEAIQAKAVRKFAVLWYLARDVIPKLASPYGRIRMLDRSLLEMLNRLQRPCGPQGSEVLSWLTHALQRGDVGSILEPVLFILLHPDTGRVSVQHVKIGRTSVAGQEPDGCDASLEASSADEARIYAISSVEGHVVYHVSNKGKGNTFQSAVARRPGSLHVPKKVFAISSLSETGGSSATSSERPTTATPEWIRDYDIPTSLENAVRHPISLFINPFGNMEGVQSSSEVEKPVDISAAHRMGTSFDDADEGVQGSNGKCASGDEDSISVDSPSSVEVVTSILDEVFNQVVPDENLDRVTLVDRLNGNGNGAGNGSGKEDSAGEDKDPSTPRDVSVHPMHTYLLLYTQCYDSERVLYALSTLRAVIGANPRLAVKALATAGVAGSRSPRQSRLFELLARHRKSIFGRNFEGELGGEATSGLRSSMYLEIVISLCLYFTRSLYPNLRHIRLTEREVSLNREVQLLAIDVLTLLLAEVASVVRDSGRGFASYVVSLLDKCKVQKTILHCALAGVQMAATPTSKDPPTFTEGIVQFNDAGDYGETFHVGIVRLLLVLVVLEDQLSSQGAAVDQEAARMGAESPTFPNPPKAPGQNSARYQPGVPICSQPMFLSSVLSALKQQRRGNLHHHWLGLVNSALPFLKKALPSVVVPVVTQLCHNLESLASCYVSECPFGGSKSTGVQGSAADGKLPVDHVVIQLEGLTTLVHYCLLDSSVTNASNSLVTTVASQPNSSIATQGLVSGPSASQILNNLINVFVPVIREAQGNADGIFADPLLATRRTLLSNLPRIVSSLAATWELVSRSQSSSPSGHPSWIMGLPKVVRQHILELLSPLSHHHGINFLAAVAITWNDKRNKPSSLKGKEVVPKCSQEQAVLVELLASIKVMPVDTFVQLVRQVVRQPPPTTSRSKKVPIEVSLLQLFYSYVCAMSGSHLVEAWSSLLALLKDGLQLNLSPPCLFLLLGTLNEFVQRTPLLEDKKDQRDLQDIAQRLVEVCTTIAGAGLEQTTWLRRNMAVKPGPQAHPDDAEHDLEKTNVASSDVASTLASEATSSFSTTAGNVKYSVQALSILAEILAQLLDVSFVSDEKEKVVPVLSALMYTVTPYLRNHSGHNVPSFRACSQLLANLSGYRYTRKAWRRDVFDLLLDPNFFQMDIHCLRSWKVTIDNLMTHDKATFHDLLGRVMIPQAGTLNLFSTKEQEYELRAQLLKRLAFVLFCSEVDQYQSSLPDIQERLSEGLRLHQVPALQAQVFLCYYVLLLRMSPHHITSLWPVIITEMVQVFLQIEQELCKESEEFRYELFSC